MRFLLSCLLFYSYVYAQDIAPSMMIQASGNVQSIVIQKQYFVKAKGVAGSLHVETAEGDAIVASTNAGTIEIYKLSDASLIKKIQFDPIKDFTGEEVAPKIFSVDALDATLNYLAVVQASNGARRLVLVEKDSKKELISEKENLFISKAKFIDNNHVLVALMSNELIVLDTKTGQRRYQVQINPSHFSDFALNESKSLVASSCESGEVSIVDVNTGKILFVLSSGNVDNVYKVDFKQQKVLTAGQDRRGIVYDTKTKAYDRYDAGFLIYAGALSPSANLGAFAFNEDNDIVIFDLPTKTKRYTLKGQKSTLNTILFASEKELVSGSDDKFIMIWRLP